MTIKVGTIIKSLRTERGVTQETLAAALGVTPQAISRWESQSCYPDMEVLPLLADFFSVSIDQLVGYRLSEREQALADIRKEANRLSEVATPKERIAYLRQALVQYPFDFDLKLHLAVALYHAWCDKGNKGDSAEIEALCLSVLDGCRQDDLKYSALFTLCSLYGGRGEPERALPLVEAHTTPMKYCREFLLAGGIGDGKNALYLQDNIDKLTDALGSAILGLVLDDERPNDPSTWEGKIAMLKTANALYPMIYGDDLMFYHSRLSHQYWLLSTYQIAKGLVEECLDSLEQMAHHALCYDRSKINDHGKRYTSSLTDQLVYPAPGPDLHELTEHNDAYYRLDRLDAPRYDGIRHHPRFQAVMERLRETAE